MADLYREKPDGLPTQEKTNGGVIQGETKPSHTNRYFDGGIIHGKTDGGVIQGRTVYPGKFRNTTLRMVLVIIGEGQLHYQTHP